MHPALVAPDCLERVLAIASAFPAAGISIYGFECHLSVGRGHADFAFKLPDAEVLSRCLECAGAAGLRPLARAWREDPRLIQDLCFEFDVPLPGENVAAPSLFFAGRPPAALMRTIDLVKGAEFAGMVRPRLERALELLPSGADLSLWGLMLARELPAVRLSALNIRPEQVRPYLEAQGWRGAAGQLERVLAWVPPNLRRLTLDLDVGATVFPTIGLELCFYEPVPPQPPYAWEPLVKTLVEDGLCSQAAADAVHAFPGIVPAATAIPRNVQAAAALLGDRELVYLRRPSHFKLAIDAAGTLIAKVYLEQYLCWGNG